MALDSSAAILRKSIDEMSPDYIVSMVSGGKDSAASDAVARELGIKIDLVIHGDTRTGIRETTDFVVANYSDLGSDFAVADAGTNYEDYVLRNGFFGVGRGPHNFAYHVLKHRPFRKVLSTKLRRRKRGVRILMIGGMRREESANRSTMPAVRPDPEQPGNVWVSPINDWSQVERDAYLDSRGVTINPVAKAICRSGECMCGTMQTLAERVEAALIYPEWGKWIDTLEAEVIAKHGFGWGKRFPRRDPRQLEMFQPMCTACVRRDAA